MKILQQYPIKQYPKEDEGGEWKEFFNIEDIDATDNEAVATEGGCRSAEWLELREKVNISSFLWLKLQEHHIITSSKMMLIKNYCVPLQRPRKDDGETLHCCMPRGQEWRKLLS